MPNMSYCRFHNTASDLMDCYEHIEDRELSRDEHAARIRLVRLCKTIVEQCYDEEGEEFEELFQDWKETD